MAVLPATSTSLPGEIIIDVAKAEPRLSNTAT